MNTQQNQVPEDMEKLKEIPKWTRKYAQNRTIPVLIGMVIFLCLFGGIGGSSYFGGHAYQAGNMVLFWFCVFVMAVSMICLFFFSVPKWGGKFIVRISKRLYGREGDVLITAPNATKKQWVVYIVGLLFGSCVLGNVFLGSMGYLKIEYMQPISAVYVVPFLVFLYFWQRPMKGPIALLWPILYTIHALLIVTGVPILFTGDNVRWNMMLPLFGYGFLTHVIGHLYSRYALKKLKTTAQLGEKTNEQ